MSRIDDIERALNKSPNEKKDNNFLLYFLLGIVLLGAGIFMVSKNTYIVASMYVWHIGGMNISSGLVAIPLFLGIGMLFYNGKSYLLSNALIYSSKSDSSRIVLSVTNFIIIFVNPIVESYKL